MTETPRYKVERQWLREAIESCSTSPIMRAWSGYAKEFTYGTYRSPCGIACPGIQVGSTSLLSTSIFDSACKMKFGCGFGVVEVVD